MRAAAGWTGRKLTYVRVSPAMVTVWVVSVKPVVSAGDGLAVDVGALTGLLGGAASALSGPFPPARRAAGPPSRPGIASTARPTAMARQNLPVPPVTHR